GRCGGRAVYATNAHRAVIAEADCDRVLSAIRNQDQSISAGLSTPGFAGAAQHLPHLRIRPIAREALEFLCLRVEAQNRILRPLGQPYLVAFVYIHSVHLRCIRRFPRLPLLSGRVVTADLARHPFLYPAPSLAVGPPATRALPGRRRLDDSGLSAFCIDVRQMTAGEREVVYLAS